jgi:hypothetical protein
MNFAATASPDFAARTIARTPGAGTGAAVRLVGQFLVFAAFEAASAA